MDSALLTKSKNNLISYTTNIKFLFLILLLHSLIVLPPLFFINNADTWIAEAWDSVHGHIPLINYLIHNPWGIYSYPNNLVSTLPGYHAFLAFISLFSGIDTVKENTWFIRIINTLFGDGLIIIVWSIVWKLKKNAYITFSLLLPLTFSYYVVASSIWINTDNVAALFYSALIFIYLFDGPVWLGGVASFLMVFCRQVYLPVTAAFWPPALFPKVQRRLLLLAFLVTFFATIIFALYVWKWKGFTPIGAQHINKFVGFNFSGLIHALAMSGILALPFMPIFFSDRKYYKNSFVLLGTIAAVISIVMWTLVPSTPNYDQGRGGSIIWHIAELSPHGYEK